MTTTVAVAIITDDRDAVQDVHVYADMAAAVRGVIEDYWTESMAYDPDVPVTTLDELNDAFGGQMQIRIWTRAIESDERAAA
jgi:hypothetical protein